MAGAVLTTLSAAAQPATAADVARQLDPDAGDPVDQEIAAVSTVLGELQRLGLVRPQAR